jgi:hypothetical protein
VHQSEFGSPIESHYLLFVYYSGSQTFLSGDTPFKNEKLATHLEYQIYYQTTNKILSYSNKCQITGTEGSKLRLGITQRNDTQHRLDF